MQTTLINLHHYKFGYGMNKKYVYDLHELSSDIHVGYKMN